MNVLSKNSLYGHVAVLYGGNSQERNISLISGKFVYDSLKESGVQCSLIDIANNVIEKLQRLKPDRAFIALHGEDGEDGVIQGLLKVMKIPFTGSDVASSALAMDKYRAKLIWKCLGLPTPNFCLVSDVNEIPNEHPFPCFIKATRQGSRYRSLSS